jgi:hypothetical protein
MTCGQRYVSFCFHTCSHIPDRFQVELDCRCVLGTMLTLCVSLDAVLICVTVSCPTYQLCGFSQVTAPFTDVNYGKVASPKDTLP